MLNQDKIDYSLLFFSVLRMNKKKLYMNATINLVVMDYERDPAQIGLLSSRSSYRSVQYFCFSLLPIKVFRKLLALCLMKSHI